MISNTPSFTITLSKSVFTVDASILLPSEISSSASAGPSVSDLSGVNNVGSVALLSLLLFDTATGADFTVRVLLLGRSASASTDSATSSGSSSTGCVATSAILSINSCLRNSSTSPIPNTFAISRNSDTSFEFNSVISINLKILYYYEFFGLYFYEIYPE